jgi:TetR/AcrR family transcriptional repressor of nem operon
MMNIMNNVKRQIRAGQEYRMRYPAAETAKKHTRILDEATRLFRERGFPGVSVSEIMKATGLTHGPFYNHFASKEELIAESIAHGLQGTLESVNAAPATAEGKEDYITKYLSTAHRDDAGTGCMIAALAAGIRQEPMARGPFTIRMKALIDRMAEHFPWRSKRTARGDAIRMSCALLGAITLARAVDDEAFSQEILNEVRRGLV